MGMGDEQVNTFQQQKIQHPKVLDFGGGGRIRTIEAKRSRFTVCPLWPLGNSPIFSFLFDLVGAGRRTRTPDLLITNQLLYQLSYTGDSNRTRLLYSPTPGLSRTFFIIFKKIFLSGF